MQPASSFEGIGSPIGALRLMNSFPETQIRNSSHIQEVYQNLPQLQKAFFLPVTYKSYESQNTIPVAYSEQPPNFSPQLYTGMQVNNHKLHYSKRRQEQVPDKDQIIYNRNGHGWGDAGHHHGHGNSPALSALALLGFMFFLQLIQNSLQNNRQMLAAAAINATAATVVAGRENRHVKGHNRRKRSIRGDNGMKKIPAHGMHDREKDKNKLFTEKPESNKDRVRLSSSERSNFSSSSIKHTKKTGRSPIPLKLKNNPIEILRSSSVHCCQLLACKIGESIYNRLDTTTGFMFRMLGATMIPRIPKKTWTGRLLRAFDKGWKKESCDSLYRNCGVLYNLFYKATNTIQGRSPKYDLRHEKKS